MVGLDGGLRWRLRSSHAGEVSAHCRGEFVRHGLLPVRSVLLVLDLSELKRIDAGAAQQRI